MKQALNLPKKIYFKTGSAPVALRELSDIYHCNRALLITDPKLYLAGVAAPVVDQLRHQGIRVAEYFTIGETVSYEDLRGALPKLNEFQPDVILGVGGENALSAAKALLALYVDSELDLTAAADDSHLIPACDKAKLVLIAADCTSGAQTSPFAVLKDDEGEIRVLKSIYLLPELSITDADFTQWLTAEGIKTNVTLVFSANQALLPARAGASYVSPFLGRLDDISMPGIDLVKTIAEIFDIYGIETEIIAASVRNPIHVTDCALAGADIATVPYSVIEQMTKHPLTDQGIEKFKADSI